MTLTPGYCYTRVVEIKPKIMLESCKSEFNSIDYDKLPTNGNRLEWTPEQSQIVESLHENWAWLWFETDSTDQEADQVLDQYMTLFNRDGGWIYQG